MKNGKKKIKKSGTGAISIEKTHRPVSLFFIKSCVLRVSYNSDIGHFV